jgi:hypothetical protein
VSNQQIEMGHFNCIPGFVLCLIIRGTIASSNESSAVHNKWFTSLKEKPTPLWLCEGFSEGVLYRIPQVKKCTLPNDPVSSLAINITVWWEDIGNQEIDAHECFALRSPVECFWVLYRGCLYNFFPDTKLDLSIEECHNMIKTNIAPNGKEMERIREGYMGTNDDRLPEGSYWYVDELERVNYYVRELKVAISNVDQSVMTLASVVETCYGQDGKCETSEGFLIWPAEKHHRCRMREGETTTCLWTEDIISCPEISLSLSQISTRSVCNNTLGYTGEGIYFTPVENMTGALEGVMTTEEAREKVKKGRVKREQKFITASEYNSRTHFIFEMVERQLNGEIQLLHHEMCKISQAVTNNMRYYAENGDPNMMIGSMLFEEKYKARLHGDVIALWKCHEIR